MSDSRRITQDDIRRGLYNKYQVKECSIRKVKPGDESALAYIQTESWKAAFQNILSEETLKRCTDINHATEMYKGLLEDNIGNGYILEIDAKPHCIAYWDKTRDEDMEGYAELICIHSLQDNWGKGYGTQMMERVLNEIQKAGYEKVMLWVFKDNDRARKFYEARGFFANGKTIPSMGTQEVCYERNL